MTASRKHGLAARTPSHRTSMRALLLGGLAVIGVGGLAGSSSGCGEEPIQVSVRALERSGRVSFVCLGPNGGDAARPMSACREGDLPVDLFEDGDGDEFPHIYALVTQETRGEIAVIDLSADDDAVLDQDPSTPGANFLPIGAIPIDIASTAGGTASFVSVAEVGREGLYVLPSRDIRPCAGCEPPQLTSWPACALPTPPGEIQIVSDPAQDGALRSSCEGSYGDVEGQGASGSIDAEGFGRQKLIVTLPEDGGFAVLDAQTLLEIEPGTYDACPIERFVALDVDVPPAPPAEPPPTGDACVAPQAVEPAPVGPFTSRPAGTALDEGLLYIADYEAPVIHTIDVSSPCDPVQLDPLLPSSVAEPNRVVTTERVAVSPGQLAGFGKVVYATDAADGSVMVFDIGEGSVGRRPIQRDDAVYNPFQPRDRIRFAAPVQDLAIVERDQAEEHPATGVAESGIRCDPDPTLTTCSSTSASCDPETLYRTSSDYETGAGPRTLRGTFAYLLLTSGQVIVIDIDDYDAACRVPTQFSEIYGCPPLGSDADAEGGPERESTDERSCNVVVPHTARSARYVLTNDDVGRGQPGVVAFPLLYEADGSLVPENGENPEPTLQMRATQPTSPTAATLELPVGNDVLEIGEDGIIVDEAVLRHTLTMNLEDPRVHSIEQEYFVTYEGPLPAFADRRGRLVLTPEDGAERAFFDDAAAFCSGGVHSAEMMRAELEALGENASEDAVTALADTVSIRQALIEDGDFYYDTASCDFVTCRNAFGIPSSPTAARDIVIREAFQDRLLLDPPSVDPSLMECCFPTLLEFEIRPGNQWLVEGEITGAYHHVIADPATGQCRNSCDPNRARLTSRVRTAPDGTVADDDPRAYVGPMFRFAITAPDGVSAKRDQQFRFVTQGAYSTLLINLASDTLNVAPQQIQFLSPTGELAITDGSLEGLLFVGIRSLTVDRGYF